MDPAGGRGRLGRQRLPSAPGRSGRARRASRRPGPRRCGLWRSRTRSRAQPRPPASAAGVRGPEVTELQGAVEMAQTEQAQGSNPEAKALAAKIVQDQTAEIADADAADAGLTRQAACLGGAQASEQAVAVARPARLITT